MKLGWSRASELRDPAQASRFLEALPKNQRGRLM